MIPEDWEGIRHFNPDETWKGNNSWGDPSKMQKPLIQELDAWRHYIDRRVFVHCGWELTGHSAGSEHEDGNGVDCHVEDTPLSVQYLAVERFSFRGIGLYPHWDHPGLHLDMRILGVGQPGARWIGIFVQDSDDPGKLEQVYVALNVVNFERYILGV